MNLVERSPQSDRARKPQYMSKMSINIDMRIESGGVYLPAINTSRCPFGVSFQSATSADSPTSRSWEAFDRRLALDGNALRSPANQDASSDDHDPSDNDRLMGSVVARADTVHTLHPLPNRASSRLLRSKHREACCVTVELIAPTRRPTKSPKHIVRHPPGTPNKRVKSNDTNLHDPSAHSLMSRSS
jgi:hypothetical protein